MILSADCRKIAYRDHEADFWQLFDKVVVLRCRFFVLQRLDEIRLAELDVDQIELVVNTSELKQRNHVAIERERVLKLHQSSTNRSESTVTMVTNSPCSS